MPTPRPAPQQDADRHNTVDLFKSLLAAERAQRSRLQGELDLRNSALDASPDHYIIIDVTRPHWVISYVNQALARDYGHKGSQIIGRTPSWLMPKEANPETYTRLEDAIRSSVCLTAEMVGRHKDGTTLRVNFRFSPIPDSGGNVAHYLGIGSVVGGGAAA